MKLQYLGCSAFVFTSNNGTNIGIDFWHKDAFPYAEDTPETLNVNSDDINRLLISHDHLDHCYIIDGVEPYYGIVDNSVTDDKNALQVNNIKIGKFNSKHFHPKWGEGEKANTIFKLNIDGIDVVHMGDSHGTMLDKPLLNELKEKIGNIDILLMPIGTPWLEKFQTEEVLVDVIDVMNPRVIVPIHYWKIRDKESFLNEIANHVDGIVKFEENLIEVNHEDLKNNTGKVIWGIPAGAYKR